MQQLAADFNLLRINSKLTDIVLRVNGQDFPAHKLILAARSPVFLAMFSHSELSENQDIVVDIPDIGAEVMERLLAFVYCGNIDRVDKVAPELLVAADKVCLVI